jgi:antirestriction protein ArdC
MPNRPTITHHEARAYYTPVQDTVNMPACRLFPKVEHYYSVLFHELTHSTGHWQRLHRQTLTDLCPFGSTNYSKEELVAEMGAAFLCGVAGIANETVDTSVAYIQSWLTKLQNDTRLVILAAAQAQKAADYILGNTASQAEQSEFRSTHLATQGSEE